MIDPATFFKAFGIFCLIIILVGGVISWFVLLFKKYLPNFKYWFKYEVLRSKHKEEDVRRLMEYDDAGHNVDQVKKFMLLKGFSLDKTNEFCYIYKKIQAKGGKK